MIAVDQPVDAVFLHQLVEIIAIQHARKPPGIDFLKHGQIPS